MREEIKLAARALRKKQTISEKILWTRLKNRSFFGKKFLRQFPIVFYLDGKQRFFIADFICHECKLVIEIDGKIHLNQKDYDQFRDLVICKLGYRVIRVSDEMIEENLETFLMESLKPSLF